MSMTTYRNVRTYKPSNSRYVGIGFVVVLHVALVIFLIHVLGVRTFEALPQDVKVKNIDIPKPDEKIPPPPPPDMKTPPPPFVPPPEINIQSNAPPPPTAITTTTVKPPPTPVAPTPVAAPPAPKVTTAPHLTKAIDTERFYPAISKRLNEEGVVQLQIYVGADGRIEDAKLAKSSGYARLDNAALNMAKSGGIPTMTPGTVDGKPAAVWDTIAIRFTIAQ